MKCVMGETHSMHGGNEKFNRTWVGKTGAKETIRKRFKYCISVPSFSYFLFKTGVCESHNKLRLS
jgi:hypothetical protein